MEYNMAVQAEIDRIDEDIEYDKDCIERAKRDLDYAQKKLKEQEEVKRLLLTLQNQLNLKIIA